MAGSTTRSRDSRLEVRTTSEERALIDRAVEASGSDLTTFVVANVTQAAHRILADRDHFELSVEAAAEWERINRRAARDLPSIRELLARPSPFAE